MPQVIRPDGLYESQQRFGLYRWHIMDPIRFDRTCASPFRPWLAFGGRYCHCRTTLRRCLLVPDRTARGFPEVPDKDYLEIQ